MGFRSKFENRQKEKKGEGAKEQPPKAEDIQRDVKGPALETDPKPAAKKMPPPPPKPKQKFGVIEGGAGKEAESQDTESESRKPTLDTHEAGPDIDDGGFDFGEDEGTEQRDGTDQNSSEAELPDLDSFGTDSQEADEQPADESENSDERITPHESEDESLSPGGSVDELPLSSEETEGPAEDEAEDEPEELPQWQPPENEGPFEEGEQADEELEQEEDEEVGTDPCPEGALDEDYDPEGLLDGPEHEDEETQEYEKETEESEGNGGEASAITMNVRPAGKVLKYALEPVSSFLGGAAIAGIALACGAGMFAVIPAAIGSVVAIGLMLTDKN